MAIDLPNTATRPLAGRRQRNGMAPMIPVPRAPVVRETDRIRVGLRLTESYPLPAGVPDTAEVRRVIARGFELFGRRAWLLVERSGAYRAVESQDDAPGWALVAELRR